MYGWVDGGRAVGSRSRVSRYNRNPDATAIGGHYTEISLVYFIEVKRVLTGEQSGASARIVEQIGQWLEWVRSDCFR